ncbi:MAG: TetR family transcriptional regulator [Gemmatimonadaceae bacterium]|jgi:AcrR family transcriptional regulator|nr:TetR family transcriptional regulator [Gemmatimonadaceae bacterium]
MSHPIARRRARSDDAKEARRSALLEAARTLLAERPFAALTMDAVAQRTGLAKGTVFLYFPTKETLGLALVEELLDEWFDALDSRLGTLRTAASAARVAAAIVDVTVARPVLVELLTILGPMLEQNVARPAAEAFKARVLVRTIQLGASFERVRPSLAPGQGAEFCLVIHALVTGLHQMAHPAPVIAELLAEETFAPLRVDFATTLAHTLTCHLLGLDRAPRSSTARRARRST